MEDSEKIMKYCKRKYCVLRTVAMLTDVDPNTAVTANAKAAAYEKVIDYIDKEMSKNAGTENNSTTRTAAVG